MTELEILLLKASYEKYLNSHPEMQLMELRKKMTDMKINVIKQEVDSLEHRIDQEVDRLEHRIDREVDRLEHQIDREEEPRCACCDGPLHTPYDPLWIFMCFFVVISMSAMLFAMIKTVIKY